jgi:hypothetical protein
VNAFLLTSAYRSKTIVQPAINCYIRHSACFVLSGPPTTALSFISPTPIGSDCCDGPGFQVEDLVEIRPGADAKTTYPFVTLEWARQWPSEEVWKVRKR